MVRSPWVRMGSLEIDPPESPFDRVGLSSGGQGFVRLTHLFGWSRLLRHCDPVAIDAACGAFPRSNTRLWTLEKEFPAHTVAGGRRATPGAWVSSFDQRTPWLAVLRDPEACPMGQHQLVAEFTIGEQREAYACAATTA